MIRDVGENKIGRDHLYDSLNCDLEEELFARCVKFTQLLATLKLFSLKARNWWTDKSFHKIVGVVEGDTYRKEFASLKAYPTCGLSPFKNKNWWK